MVFVERTTEEGNHVVVLRYAALFYWLMWPTLAVTIWASNSNSGAAFYVALAAWIALVMAAAPYWQVTWELKRQMATSSITASGSKYSFSNPLTYRWKQNST